MITKDELVDWLEELPKRPYPFASLQPDMHQWAELMRKEAAERPLEGNAKAVWEELVKLSEDIAEGKR